MTKKDSILINHAKSVYPTDWGTIHPDEAESDEARETLERIKKRKYHDEEHLISNQ